MKTMIGLGSSGQRGHLQIIDTPTSVDCGRDVRFRRSFRTLVQYIVPACCSDSASASSTVTCTFFGHRKGKVSLCIQQPGGSSRAPPLLLLEFGVPTSYLAREMQHGLLRIALESRHSTAHLYDVPVWCIYCNGTKVGFATRRHMTPADATVMKLMHSVSVGAGVLPLDHGDLMYLRATFDRVIGSADSESFHMINPVGSSGQELSIFLLRRSEQQN